MDDTRNPRISKVPRAMAEAISLAELGLAAIAVVPGTKKPAEKWANLGFRSPADIRQTPIFRRRNIAVGFLPGVTDHVSIDVDTENAQAWLRDQVEKNEDPIRTRKLQTRPDRIQLVFHADGREFKTQAGQVTDGLDVRGRGGMVKTYDPKEPDRKWLNDLPIAKISEWLADQLPLAGALSPNGHAPLDVNRLVLAGIPPGQHDDTMTELAWQLRRNGMDLDAWMLAAEALLARSHEGTDAAGDRREPFTAEHIAGWWRSADAKISERECTPDQEATLAELHADARAGRWPLRAHTGRQGWLGQVLDRAELRTLPKPEPMIERWLDRRTAVVMVGDTGTNKTFTALGMACSCALAVDWLGHKVLVEAAPVILVIGEGAGGLDDRIAAWEAEHNDGKPIPADRLLVVRLPKTISDRRFWRELTDLAVTRGAHLVLFDTWSSLAPDADEVKDAAQTIRWLTELAVAINGAAVLIHHTGWTEKARTRGGSQLEANPDSVIVLEKADDEDPESPVRILRKKDKDGPSRYEVWVRRKLVGESCVLELCDPPAASARSAHRWRNDDYRGAILSWMSDRQPEGARSIQDAVYTEHKDAGATRDGVRTAFESLARDGDIAEIEKTVMVHPKGRKSYERKTAGWAVTPPVKPHAGASAYVAAEASGGGRDHV